MAGFRFFGRFSLIEGPELGYLLNANEISNGLMIEVTDQFRRFEFGLAAGLRYGVGNKWGAELRYIYGIYGIAKSVVDIGSGNYGYYGPGSEKDNKTNRVFQMGLYYDIL